MCRIRRQALRHRMQWLACSRRIYAVVMPRRQRGSKKTIKGSARIAKCPRHGRVEDLLSCCEAMYYANKSPMDSVSRWRCQLSADDQARILAVILSQQIRPLESDLGLTLLERTPRRVSLTADGATFLTPARGLWVLARFGGSCGRGDPRRCSGSASTRRRTSSDLDFCTASGGFGPLPRSNSTRCRVTNKPRSSQSEMVGVHSMLGRGEVAFPRGSPDFQSLVDPRNWGA